MLTPLEIRKLRIKQDQLGLMSAGEALNLALESEDTAKKLGPFDPAFTYFKSLEIAYEDYAYLLEKAP